MSEKKFKGNCELIEFVEKKMAYWLLNNIDDYPCRHIDTNDYSSKTVCIQYLNEILKSKNGCIKRIYYNNNGLGRMYLKKGQTGFQSLMREYRALLCYKNYYDLDIKNAQPTILLNICQNKKIDCDALQYYVQNRDSLINENYELNKTNYDTKDKFKDDFKLIFISIMYGSKCEGKLNYTETTKKFIKKFIKEMNKIMDTILDENENIIFVEEAKLKKEENIKGSALSYYLQNLENIIIQFAAYFLKKKHYEIGALVFDGLMIRNNIPLTSIIIKDLEKYIHKNTNIKIEMVIKSFDVKLIPTDNELNNYKEDIIIKNDAEASQIILKDLNNEVVKCDNRYYYRKYPNTNIYVEDKSPSQRDTHRLLFSIIMNYDIKIETEKGCKDYSKKTSGCKQIVEATFDNLKNQPKFTETLFISNRFKLCFLNGYYDIIKKEFKSYDNECFTMKYINKEYKQNVSESDINILNEKILNPIIGTNNESRTMMLRWFSRALFGCQDKKWAVGLGNRNTGKSVFTKLFELSFGNYVKVFNAENLMASKVGNGDTAKKLSWVVPFEYCRLYLSNEMKTIDDTGKNLTLDCNQIKSISSGGDTKEARQNYENEKNFELQGNMCLFMNELAKLSHADAKENLYQFNFNNIFVKEINDEHKKINLEGDGCKYLLADDNIKFLLLDENIQHAFIKIIIDNYGDNIKNIIDDNDFDETDNDFTTQILANFEITLNKKDRIPIKQFNEILVQNCIKASKSGIKLFLDKKGIGSAVFPKEGRVYTGIKQIVINQD